MDATLAVVLILWVVGFVLLAMQPRLPMAPRVVCPRCSLQTTALMMRSCDTVLAAVLILLLPLIGVIYVLVTRGKVRLRCAACKGLITETRGVPMVSAPPVPSAASPVAAAAPSSTPLESCDNCGRAIGKLEAPHLWQDHVVCAQCRGILEEGAQRGRP